MEAISHISRYTTWLLLIIPVGAAAAVTYFNFKKSVTEDDGEIGDCNRRIKNTFWGAVIGMSISGFITMISKYF